MKVIINVPDGADRIRELLHVAKTQKQRWQNMALHNLLRGYIKDATEAAGMVCWLTVQIATLEEALFTLNSGTTLPKELER